MKTVYILMALLAGLLFSIGDAYFKTKAQSYMDIKFFDYLRFWTLPVGLLFALAVTYGLGVFSKFLSIYPLREVDISAFAPVVVVCAMMSSVFIGVVALGEHISLVRGTGIILAALSVYLLSKGA